MPTLRLSFPEKDAPSTITLKGARITLGRQPQNTIQIIDRTISGTHAELIAESDGHYRLHDLGSTNGTFVDGKEVEDFHLTQPCKVSFGTLECDFSPETPAESEEAEGLATRAELETLRHLNAGLHANIDILCEEIDGLKRIVKTGAEADSQEVLQVELQRMIAERADLRETEHRHADEIAHLKNELALLRRDRDNLQSALKASATELERMKTVKTAAAQLEPAPVAAIVTVPAASVIPMPSAVSSSSPSPMKPFPAAPKPTFPPPTAPSLAPAAKVPMPAGRPLLQPTARPVVPTATVSATPKVVGPSGTQRIPAPGAPVANGSPAAVPAGPKVIPKFVSMPRSDTSAQS